MAYWSIYLSPAEERILKRKVKNIAEKKRWSFSQAVTGILREHLIEERKRIPDEEVWTLLTAKAFFEGYSKQDEVYDSL